MNFIREDISDTEFSLLDFESLNISSPEIPSRPTTWAIDRAKSQFLLPLEPDIFDMRERMGACIFVFENMPIRLRITFGNPNKFSWLIWKTFDRSRIKEISSAAQNAITTLYGFDKANIQFEIHDHWAPKSETELVEHFERWASLSLPSDQIAWFTKHDRDILAAYKSSKLKWALLKIRGRKPFDIKKTAKKVASRFSESELSRIIFYINSSNYLLSKDANYVLEAIQKFNIKGSELPSEG